MKCVLFVAVLDAKIIHYKDKGEVASVVFPEPGCVSAFIVAVSSKAFAKEIVGKDTGLWKAVHTFAYFGVYPTVVDEVVEIVFDLDLLGYVVNVETYVFV